MRDLAAFVFWCLVIAICLKGCDLVEQVTAEDVRHFYEENIQAEEE